MPRIDVSHLAPAAPDRVFEIYSDIRRVADRVDAIKNIEMLTPGPVGQGTRFRETRVVFKKEHNEELEFVEFVPGKSYTVGCTSCGAEYRTRYDFRPEGSGTRVDVVMQITAMTLGAKLFAPLGFLMSKSMRKCLEADMVALDKVFEKTAEASAGA